MIVVLAGGVGAARFLEGLVTVVPPEEVLVISNTGDDLDFFGLRVCPDIDTVVYTLASVVNSGRGWGQLNDSFHALAALRRFQPDIWFNLGDHDLATSLYRSRRLHEGATLSGVTAEIVHGFGLRLRLIPMSDARVATRIQTPAGELAFQEYFVQRRCEDEVLGVRFEGGEAAQPAPGVIDAILKADAVLIAPSNPFVSIGPILGVDGIRRALHETAAPVIAISPIVGGEAIKGPAAAMLRSLGSEASAVEVARLYRDFLDVLVIDRADAALAPLVESVGPRVAVTDTIMRGRREKANLARAALSAAGLNAAP